jgi:hypothetical protein
MTGTTTGCNAALPDPGKFIIFRFLFAQLKAKQATTIQTRRPEEPLLSFPRHFLSCTLPGPLSHIHPSHAQSDFF